MRFGLLGTGYWAREVHATALASHPDADFVGVWGRNPAKATEFAGLFGIRAFNDVDQLLAEVDAVAIALPPDVQAELALRAARAGRHLLLDKPLALTVEAADAVVAEVEARKLASVLFFTNRFQPTTVQALAEITATGGWLGGQAIFFGSIYGEGNPYAESAWRHQHGGLWDIGPHALSLLIPVLGPVVAVSATTGPRQTTYVTLRHESGAVSTMALTLDSPPAAARMETQIHGEPGWVTLPGFDGDAVASFKQAISQLIASVPTATHPLDVRFGRDVVAILAAAQTSTTTGGTTSL
ncbi:MAG TPA: oxidoreductase [Micromonosporaceae bacterium]|nr:oxidoreductase [Micromonosporaceae bacterium]HCU49206.1 oxidoreductase [Micromonosporaceae bacterium]